MRVRILLEGLSYRVGDLAIGFLVGFLIALVVTHDYGDAFAIGGAASLAENGLNTLWYWINRRYWTSGTGMEEHLMKMRISEPLRFQAKRHLDAYLEIVGKRSETFD